MNKKFIVVAIGAALAGSAFAQSSNVTLYGRINTAIESNRTGNGGSEVAMRSYSSRLGVRGVEDLGDGLKGIFGYEAQFASDTSGGLADTRNAYVGVDTGANGRIVLGRLDAAILAPLYNQVTSVIDTVGYDAGINALIMANGRNLGAFTSGASSTAGTAAANTAGNGVAANVGGSQAANSSGTVTQNDSTIAAQQRVSNAIGYAVQFGDIGVQARYSLNGTNDVVPGNAGSLGENNARNLELAANYKSGPLTAGVGFEQASYSNNVTVTTTEALAKAAFKDRLQGVVGYTIGDIKLGALIARNKIDATTAGRDDSGTEFALSGTYSLSPKAALVANYARRDLLSDTPITAADPANAKRTQVVLGGRYDFTKRTQAFATLQRLDSNDKVSNNDIKSLTVGLRHNF